jgi:ribosomal protein S18 acetylase RimI-like enzyme
MAIVISRASPADADAIAALLHTCWADTYGSFLSADALNTIATEWHSPDVLRRQIGDPRTLFLVARPDPLTIVGIATAKRSRDETVLTVLRLYVLPNHQRRGVGTELLNKVLAASPRTRRVELEVAEGNPTGLSFWIKQGFRPCGRTQAKAGSTAIPLIAMEREVAA